MFLGIDLGTTYSVGSYIAENGEPKVIINTEGNNVTPSVVYFENKNSVVVGQAAKDNSIILSLIHILIFCPKNMRC